jgi:hypothetical protein
VEHAITDERASAVRLRRLERRVRHRAQPTRESLELGDMFQPRRLRTRRPSSVETTARNPSHLTSKAHSVPVGIDPGRKSMGRRSINGGYDAPPSAGFL